MSALHETVISVFSNDLPIVRSLRGSVASSLRAYFSSWLRVSVSVSPSWLCGFVASWL